MAQVLITTSLLDGLADAISLKTSEETPMTIAEMTDAVENIVVPSGSINITNNGNNIDVAAYAIANVSVSGTTPILQTKTKSYTPTETEQTETIAYDNNYDGLEEVDITVEAISSTYVGSSIAVLDDTDIINQGNNFVIPEGYFPESAQVWVNTGTAGTPTATKGAVSNHSISVTPSVTNSTGYITGSTKTGTAVNVTASELDSGNKSITSNGNNIDVVGYATVSVAVPFVTYYTGSGTPSSSLGSNGDIYLQTS